MDALSPGHIVVILAVAILVFGPGKVAEIGGQLGRGMRDFRDAMEGRTPAVPTFPAPSAFCTGCGARLADDARYCTACGHSRAA